MGSVASLAAWAWIIAVTVSYLFQFGPLLSQLLRLWT